MDFDSLKKRFSAYAATFAEDDGSFLIPIARKISHTDEVCSITEELVRNERKFSEREAFLFRVCALFHDISRFEQYRDYRTFRDADSFDHGFRSAEIMLSGGFLDELPEPERNLVASAIRVHNKFAIPADFPPEFLSAARMLRDADKLAILLLILEFFRNPQIMNDDKTIKLDLPDTPGFSEPLAREVLAGHCVRYTDMRSVNDFKVTIFAWANDLNYASSAVYALEQQYYPRLRSFLPPSPLLDELLRFAESRLNALKNGDVPNAAS